MGIRHKRAILLRRGRNRKKRSKTFKTEEAAKKFAQDNKISKFSLVNIKSDESKTKKIKIVVE